MSKDDTEIDQCGVSYDGHDGYEKRASKHDISVELRIMVNHHLLLTMTSTYLCY